MQQLPPNVSIEKTINNLTLTEFYEYDLLTCFNNKKNISKVSIANEILNRFKRKQSTYIDEKNEYTRKQKDKYNGSTIDIYTYTLSILEQKLYIKVIGPKNAAKKTCYIMLHDLIYDIMPKLTGTKQQLYDASINYTDNQLNSSDDEIDADNEIDANRYSAVTNNINTLHIKQNNDGIYKPCYTPKVTTNAQMASKIVDSNQCANVNNSRESEYVKSYDSIVDIDCIVVIFRETCLFNEIQTFTSSVCSISIYIQEIQIQCDNNMVRDSIVIAFDSTSKINEFKKFIRLYTSIVNTMKIHPMQFKLPVPIIRHDTIMFSVLHKFCDDLCHTDIVVRPLELCMNTVLSSIINVVKYNKDIIEEVIIDIMICTGKSYADCKMLLDVYIQ